MARSDIKYCCCYKCSLTHFLIVFILITNHVNGGRIPVNMKSRRVPSDMSVYASEESPEMTRKDIVEMIHKSQYFQDIFSEQPDPMIIQFGHVCENPTEWEQRFEQRDFNSNHYQGKMRWGNRNGDYGEHYWDLGHAG
ncbi:uncharacterized protein LOC106650317 [Trichogramma pretiosum]|uniref:uncharacterized protein LOC106650317 n=1 Tax=Trichogramma pretiosum TaxID=7493 RepID=UPI0006C9938D|nr:uncharacterized protein LOC106650317 [Trichogramma pretiosum]